MTRLLWLAAGLAAGAIVALALLRGTGIGTRRDPLFLEARLARASWRWLVPPAIRDTANPVPATPEELKAAREHWADHCATCHGNNGSGDSTVGRRVYPPAPDLRGVATQSLTDGELFYAIEQGIPWTAMPGWGTGSPDGERESWQLVRFVRHLPSITAEELQEMERLNPKSPADEQRERDIEDFLKGPAVPQQSKPSGSIK
jgi:mono/diheme cytochrome c family protein